MTRLPIIVQKYGGSSLRDHASLRAVARQVVARQRQGCRLVVVVSAMGSTTDALLQQAHTLLPHPPQRELDMLLTAGERMCMALLCMAVFEAGGHAVSLTGSQSGIITEDAHQGARVVAIRPGRILAILDKGHIAIVAGYQGVSLSHEITTLGRGGSDTTAVALGAALQCEAIELCSDVDGVYDADPRVCPQARHLPAVGYTLMGDMAHFGARVLHDQAVAFAARAGIEVVARATAQAHGKSTRLGPDIAFGPWRFAVTSIDGALWLQEPRDVRDLQGHPPADGAQKSLWSLWPDLQAHGLQVLVSGGSQALCRFVQAACDDGVVRAQKLLGSHIACSLVDAVTLVSDGPLEGHIGAAQAALQAAGVPIVAAWTGARTLTLAVHRGSGTGAVRVLHGLLPA